MRSFNVFDGALTEAGDRPGYTWRRARVGEAVDAAMLGASLYELQPGERTWPYHYEYGNEEWMIVLAGRPTLRHTEGEDDLRPGDVVCFREGPEGAHQVRNESDELVRVLILSTKQTPDAAVYPDSGKMGVWSGHDADPGRLFRIASEVDYWDGEP